MEENSRYSRQIHKDLFTIKEQQLLANSTVVICGSGGLGTPAATYLAMAGVGTIHLIDYDTIELSNLNRQFMYCSDDIGKPKALILAQRLSKLNEEINVYAHVLDFAVDSLTDDIFSSCDIILDCLDSMKARAVLGQKAIKLNKSVIHGGIRTWFGQISIFYPNEKVTLYHLPQLEEEKPFTPTLGAIPGIIGASQALEALKFLTKIPTIDSRNIYVYDGLLMKWSCYNKEIFITE